MTPDEMNTGERNEDEMRTDEKAPDEQNQNERSPNERSPNERNQSAGFQEFQNRRKKSDWITKMASILSLISWVVMLAVWTAIFLANRGATEATSALGDTVRYIYGTDEFVPSSVDRTALVIAFGLLIASLAICVVAFFFNKLRMRRKTDKYRKSVFVAGGVTIIALVVFLIVNGGYFLW